MTWQRSTRADRRFLAIWVQEQYSGLWEQAPALFDVVLTNPPFGGQENADVQTRFAYRTSATQILFLQHVIDSMAHGGRCGIVVDEGVMFRTNENAFVQTKRKLLDGCDLWCVVSLPPGTFTATGAGVKNNLMFFTRGRRITKPVHPPGRTPARVTA